MDNLNFKLVTWTNLDSVSPLSNSLAFRALLKEMHLNTSQGSRTICRIPPAEPSSFVERAGAHAQFHDAVFSDFLAKYINVRSQ